MVKYVIAGIAGLILYVLLRQLLGPEIMVIVALAALGIAGVVVVQNLRTNRKVAEATPEARTQALAFTTEPGKAALYVLRTQFIGKAVGVNLEIDGKQITQLKSPRFARVTLNPGPHRISAYMGTPDKKKPGEALLEGNAQPGEILVLKVELDPQMVGVNVKLIPVELDKAREDLQKTRMVAAEISVI